MAIEHMAQRTITIHLMGLGALGKEYVGKSANMRTLTEVLTVLHPEIVKAFGKEKLKPYDCISICEQLGLTIKKADPKVEWTGPLTPKKPKPTRTKKQKKEDRKKRIKERADARADLLTETQYKALLTKAKLNKDWEWFASKEFLLSMEWKNLRFAKLSTSKRVCACCGRGVNDGITLNVDHIKPRKLFPELALELSNLQILCNECNAGKSNFSTKKF